MRHLRRHFSLVEAASWLSARMDAARLPQAHLVGHSMGGYVCLRLAASRPESVRRLVLAAPAGVPTGRSMLGHLIPSSEQPISRRRASCPYSYATPSEWAP